MVFTLYTIMGVLYHAVFCLRLAAFGNAYPSHRFYLL